jgi:hypothetical protein
VIRDAVILVGAPRSGTTVLFETLGRSSHLWSLGKESHEILEGPFHPRHREWESNALGAEDLEPETAGRLRADYARRVKPGAVWRYRAARREARPGPLSLRRLRYRLGRLGVTFRRRFSALRLLEKTPKNCLRIPFLQKLFPGAKFVFLSRDGRPTISSMMDGWREPGLYETYRVPVELAIGGYEGSPWCFLLPRSWRELAELPLEEVCAAQWLQAVGAVLEALPRLRRAGAVHELRYEDMVADPRAALLGILEFLGLPWEDEILPEGNRLRVVNALTPPDPDKWRRRNGAAVERIMPRIEETQALLGYED